jgi:uncharacterized protein
MDEDIPPIDFFAFFFIDGVMYTLEDAESAFRRGDYATSLRMFHFLAKQGDTDAQCWLGLMYAYGCGVERNETEAVEWYRRAAEQGHVRAQCNLGLMYAYGRGVVQDDREAIQWLRKAAEQGNDVAQYHLELLYLEPGNNLIKHSSDRLH